MATPTKDAPPTRHKTAAPKPGAKPTGPMDAVDVLMADHREAEAPRVAGVEQPEQPPVHALGDRRLEHRAVTDREQPVAEPGDGEQRHRDDQRRGGGGVVSPSASAPSPPK